MKQWIATKGIIRNKEGKILLIREADTGADTVQIGVWTTVGGRIDPAEKVADGFSREIMEEAGIEVHNPVLEAYEEWFPKPHGEEWHIVALFFICDYHGPDDGIVLSDEHDAYQWVEPKECKAIMIENEGRIVERYCQKYLK